MTRFQIKKYAADASADAAADIILLRMLDEICFMFIDIDSNAMITKAVVMWDTSRMVMAMEKVAMLFTSLDLEHSLLHVVWTGPQTSRGRENFPSSKIVI